MAFPVEEERAADARRQVLSLLQLLFADRTRGGLRAPNRELAVPARFRVQPARSQESLPELRRPFLEVRSWSGVRESRNALESTSATDRSSRGFAIRNGP